MTAEKFTAYRPSQLDNYLHPSHTNLLSTVTVTGTMLPGVRDDSPEKGLDSINDETEDSVKY